MSDFSRLQEWFINGITWQFFWWLVKAAFAGLIAATVTQKAFGILKERKQQIVFGLGVFALSFLFISVFEHATQSQPNLAPTILQSFIGSSDDKSYKSTIVVMASITNRGNMPSIVKDWHFTASLNGADIDGQLMYVSDIFQVHSLDGRRCVTYSAQDALYDKTELSPISAGGMTTGFLVFGFPNIAQDSMNAQLQKISLSFEDALSTSYKISSPWVGQSHDLSYVPGMKQKMTCPTLH